MPPYSSDKLLSKRRHQESIKQESSIRAKSRVKCVLVGDGAVGKTSLVVSYTTNGFPTEYIPTAYDNYNVIVSVDGQPLRLQLCDTAGQDDFDSLRPLCYAGTDVFVICFSVVSPASLHNAAAKWVPEVKAHCPEAVILLVGTQSDLRADVGVLVRLARYGERPVNEAEARRLVAQSGASGYVECSALTQHNLKEVFDQAIMCALRNQARRHPPHPRPPCRPPLRPPTTKHKTSVWRKLCCCVGS